MLRIFSFLIVLFASFFTYSQQFYHLGSEEDFDTIPQFGILLAGGATDNNNGMRWLANRANGGDVVVLRSSGGSDYNPYIYSQLGVSVNSVTTIVIGNRDQANNPTVCEAVANAELIFIAGGNQWNYINHWKGSCLQQAINHHVNEKKAPIGGTSAGLAVLGEVVFTAVSNSVWTEEALGNPFHFRVRLAKDFLHVPFMENVVTDSHYNRIYGDDNNRHGRHVAFMARMIKDWDMNAKGIGVNEYTAVGVDENGIAHVFGNPARNDFAFFIQSNSVPDVCVAGEPLHWDHNQQALSVYRIRGDLQGSNTFDLSNWQTGEGGEWFYWYVLTGQLHNNAAPELSTEYLTDDNSFSKIKTYPNPVENRLVVQNNSGSPVMGFAVFDTSGRKIHQERINGLNPFSIDFHGWEPGIYFLHISGLNELISRKIIRR